MSQSSPTPPKWADRFLGWYCNAQVREQVQGDAHELFYWRLEEEGHTKARKAFMWDVIRLFKWSNIRRKPRQKQQLNNIAMFKNYFKIGLRNLWKQKMPSTINIIGLSLAVGCCLVAFKWIESNFVKDNFHYRTSDTYLVTPTRTVDGNKRRYAQMSLAASDMLREEVPGIDMMSRHVWGWGTIKVKNNEIGNSYYFTDPNFLDVFRFPMLHGGKEALKDPRSVILSENRAKALFGDEYPVGQELSIEINGNERFFVVGGVIENAPDNSSLRPDMLVSFSVFEEYVDKSSAAVHAFVVLNESVSPDALSGNLEKLVAEKNKLTPKSAYDDLRLEPITKIGVRSEGFVGGFGGTPPMAPIVVLSCIGAFMLLLSTFNYVNIATVMAMKRVKEIGVRKVIGSRRGQLIAQFLTENLILCALAIVLGCLLASAFFIPWFNEISGSTLTLDLLNHKNLWLFLLILLGFITFVSGAYPAFYISAFKPVNIFRGNSQKNGKRRLTGVLLTFQMTLSVIAIIAGIMFVKTNQVNKARDWGYDQYNKLVIRKPQNITFKTLEAELKKKPDVEEVAISSAVAGQNYNFGKAVAGDFNATVKVMMSGANYPEILKVRPKEGTLFNTEAPSENTGKLVVNETFMSSLQLDFKDDPQVMLDSVRYSIIGVVEDYHNVSFSETIRPEAFRVVADSMMNTVTISVRAGTILDMKEEVEKLLTKLDPENKKFTAGFQDSVFDSHFEEMEGISNIMLFTATLAMLLSAMGLFGLVSLSISSRQKDFSIKKVLGASLRQLSGDIYKRFLVILSVAIVLGGTASVFLIGMLLDSAYGYREDIGVLPVFFAGLILVTVAAITINTQVINVKRMNPADTLRSE